MPDDTDWQSDGEEQKKKKRAAANLLFEDILKDPDLRDAVLENRQRAYDEFAKRCAIHGIEVPAYVEVICLRADRKERNKLVVFVLPDDSIASAEYWRDGWIAAWEPY